MSTSPLVSDAVQAKASRLLAEQRVLIGVAGYVQGDHGTYTVSVKAGKLACDCAARGVCAHAVAVQRLIDKVTKP